MGTFRFLASLVRRLLPAHEQSQESQNMMVSLAADFGISLKRRDAVDVCLEEAGSVRAVAGLTVAHHVDTAAPENAWLESPEFATFFGRIDTATGIWI